MYFFELKNFYKTKKSNITSIETKFRLLEKNNSQLKNHF